MVDASGRNVSGSIPMKAAAKFVWIAPRLGITVKTVADTAFQLIRELLTPALKCRRRTFQAVYAFDIFYKQLTDARPEFATFFTNHVASAMHRYWAATFPADYDNLEYTKTWQETYSAEIWYAMQKADEMIGRLIQFCNHNNDYCLLITSSMGQAASGNKIIRSQLYLTDVEKFMKRLGVPSTAWSRRRAMQPEINLSISVEYLQTFRENLVDLRLNSKPLTYVEREHGFFSFDFGNANLEDRQCRMEFRNREFAISEFGLENVMIQDQAGSTGYHIPEGILLFYDPRQRAKDASRTRVSTLEIAPAILRYMGLAAPDYMKQQSPLFEALH
jgi:hypothetical protein